MKGWKTWTGAGLVFLAGGMDAVGSATPELGWLATVAQGMLTAGAALGLVGVGHKIEKQKQ